MVLGETKKKWIHSSENLIKSKVSYQVKFIGKAEVDEPRGIDVARAALQKLSFNKQLKRSEGTKPAKVLLNINIKGIKILDSRSKNLLHAVPLQQISFCSDDKKDKHLFSFIAKIEGEQHYCFGFESANEANDITLTIGQAFDVAYQEFLRSKEGTVNTKKMLDLHKKVNELVIENSKLKERIAQLEGDALKHKQQGNAGDDYSNITGLSSSIQNQGGEFSFQNQNMLEKKAPGAVMTSSDPFNMQPFVAQQQQQQPPPIPPQSAALPGLVKLPMPQQYAHHPTSQQRHRSKRGQQQLPVEQPAHLPESIINLDSKNNILPSSLDPTLLLFDPLYDGN